MGGPAQTAEFSLVSSFRDPNGVLFAWNGRIFRIVNAAGMADLKAFLASGCAAKWASAGALIRTAAPGDAEKRELLQAPEIAGLYARIGGEVILEHERIPFPSFPYEWPPEMLHRAAALTLELALGLLPESLGLKDATPYNILFRGPQPVFIDVLSFERRDPGDPAWLAYAQFVRTFLLPLLANRHLGLALDQALLARRDGLEPEEVYAWLGPLKRMRPPFFSLVSMPVWLALRHRQDDSIYRKRALPDAERAKFILTALLKGLQRQLRAAAPKADARSAWSGYMEANSYAPEQFAAKERFVEESLAASRPKQVLDVGCNTGKFSFMAARGGARVVAIDCDPVVAGNVWRQAAAERLDVLPLVVNLARPTPGTGWNNSEYPSFLARARGAFDTVLMLAVVHHLLVTERIPLDGIVDLAADLTTDKLVIEFVAPEDAMFKKIVRGREDLHSGLTAAVFEDACGRRFDILRSQRLDGAARWLYLMRRKGAAI